MRARSLLAAMTLLLAAAPAKAHPITVDGANGDWYAVSPNGFNVGRVQRDAGAQGEFYWADEAGDERTDFTGGSPNPFVDIRSFRVTGDATNLYVLVETGPLGGTPSPLQVQVAIDLDLVPVSGQQFMAGFADTEVARAAYWERLLQTQILMTGGPRLDVLDASFTRTPGAGTVAVGVGGVEISVPWTALGLTGPPRQMQVTVATFHEDIATGNTIDIGGATNPDALDVVTDYADQPNQSFNTFAEFGVGTDLVISHFTRLWMNGSGEVVSPLLVSRFVSDAAGVDGGEWIELRNVSMGALDLTSFKVGDEETPGGGGEGMRLLPGSTLAAGSTLLLAASATSFNTFYGSAPDGELGALTSYPGWATGSVTLANNGDEILVLGVDNTILDAVTYGTATFPGTSPLVPDPPNVSVAVRTPSTTDTDDNDVDFVVVEACGSPSDCSGDAACNTCVSLMCAPEAAGVACPDADLCNGDETCDGAGVCAAGSALMCDDSNPCTADACDATAGCTNTNVSDGTACADADLCNGDETCMTGTCTAGTPLACDDSNPCTADACDATTGCSNTNVADGTACLDADMCNGAESCVAGVCTSGTPPMCNDGNPCTANACDATSGCTATNVADGTSCADADVCDGDEICSAGTCVAGTPLMCDDSNPCTADACDATTGCSNTDVADGTACLDADVCNGAESCMSGVCMSGASLMCDDADPCTTDTCDATSGCVNTMIAGCMPDGGPPDGGPALDAGPMVDGGTVDPDGGTSDAGAMSMDGGAPMSDGGGPGPTDGGPTDEAGVVPFDAGPGPMTDGGCSCRATGGGRSGAPWLLVGLLAILLRRRRERR